MYWNSALTELILRNGSDVLVQRALEAGAGIQCTG